MTMMIIPLGRPEPSQQPRERLQYLIWTFDLVWKWHGRAKLEIIKICMECKH